MSKKSILDQLDMFDQPQEYPKSVKKKPSRREKREANAQQQNRMALKNIVPITDTQKAAFTAWNADKNLVLHGVAGTGKAQPITSKVKIPYGWTEIGKLKIGDKIVTPDGGIANVNGVFPQGILPVYEIEFYDGRKTKSCGDHLWKITSSINGDIDKVMKLSEIASCDFKKNRYGVPLIIPEETPDIDVPLHPYLLGVLIGDGGLTNGINFTTEDREIVDNISKLGYEVNKIKSSKNIYSIHNIRKTIKNLGLFGKRSFERHIPQMYMHKLSAKQKIELLQGLIDTDGYVSKNGSVSYTTTSNVLINDIAYLVRSLGGTAKISYKDKNFYTYKGEKKIGRPSWTVSIRHRNIDSFMTLSRKKNRITSNQYGSSNLKIKSITHVGTDECVCISVDSEDHLYITDDFIVTHNTFIAIYLALKAIEAGEYEKLIIVRSVVPTRDMGFLPGSMAEKIKVYETPYHSIFSQLYGRGDAYEIMKNKGVVSFTSTSFMRGDTLDNCIIVVDECSNLTFHESDTIITRMGDDSKIIFCGDEWQSDLRYQDERAGLKRFLSVLKAMSEFSTHEFTENDIVRSALVRSYIIQRLRQKV